VEIYKYTNKNLEYYQ